MHIYFYFTSSCSSQRNCPSTWCGGLSASVTQGALASGLSQLKNAIMPGRSKGRGLIKYSRGLPGWGVIQAG